MNTRELYAEYDAIMIGKRKGFSDIYLRRENATSMKYALAIMRYAFEKYLQWGPDVVKAQINKEIMELMHLDLLMKYIQYPVEYDKTKDYFYLALLMYGGVNEAIRNRTIHIYEKIIAGELSKYPKDYFVGNDGIVRAGICLQYMITNYVSYKNMNDLYHIFSTEEGYKLLSKYKLLHICRETFDTPVDFLHFVLPAKLKNPFYLNYYRYKFMKEMINPNGRKRREMVDYKLKGDF